MVQLPDDVIEFLEQPRQVAVLATLSEDGFPHLTSMWYAYDDGILWMWTQKERKKYINIQQEPKVGVYIRAENDVHLGVTLTALVRSQDDPKHPAREARFRQIASRYVDEGQLVLWVDHLLYVNATLIQVEPLWFARNGSSWNL